MWRKKMMMSKQHKIAEKRTYFSVALALLLTVAIILPLADQNALSVEAQTTTAIPSELLQYEWPEPFHDASHTYFNPGPAPSSPSISWKVSIPGVSGYPIAINGMVFVQASGKTYALDGATGRIVWTNNVTGNMQKIDSTYMAIGRTCVKVADGSTVWTTTLPISGQSWSTGCGYVPELKMFLDAQYGISLPDPSQPPVLVYNLTSQANIQVGYPMYGGGKLFIGSNDGFLRAYDAKTGTLLWKTPSSSMFFYGMSYIDGKVVFGGLDNKMVAWDANTGKELWTYNPQTWCGQWAMGTAVAYGMIYEHNQDTYVYAINATTGQMVWRAKGPGIGYSNTLSVAGGKVYVQMGEYQYRDFDTGAYAQPEYNCYDAYTGQLLWSLPLENSAPNNYQCVAYGNLYLIPTTSSPSVPGVWSYTGQSSDSGVSLGEVWCIGSTPQDWAMFMNDPAHTGDGAGPTDLALRWTFPTDGQIYSSPAISNGVCYFGSTDSNIYAVDANNGAQKWAFNTTFPVVSSPAIANGKVYTGADSGSIYCIDAATGTQVWKTFAGGITNNVIWNSIAVVQCRSSPVVVNNRVYVGALDGNLYCLDANSGTVLWKCTTNGPIYVAPTVVDNAVYFPSTTGGYPVGWGPTVTNGSLYKLDANTGAVIWQKQIPYVLNATSSAGNFFLSTVTYGNGMVFLRNSFLKTYGINATTGDIIWIYSGQFNPGTPSQAGGVVQINAPLYRYGALYMNDYYGVVCLNALNGSRVWYTWTSRENLSPALAYAYNRIYTVNEIGVLYVLDSITGEKLSYYDQFGYSQMHAAPSLYNGSLYVGVNDFKLYCLGDARIMAAAAQAASTQTPSPAPASITEPTPTVTVASTPAPTPVPTATPAPTPVVTPTLPPQTIVPAVASSPPAASQNETPTLTYTVIGAVVAVVVIVALAVLLLKRHK
jgi:outer membrane protein assembly factor BamB